MCDLNHVMQGTLVIEVIRGSVTAVFIRHTKSASSKSGFVFGEGLLDDKQELIDVKGPSDYYLCTSYHGEPARVAARCCQHFGSRAGIAGHDAVMAILQHVTHMSIQQRGGDEVEGIITWLRSGVVLKPKQLWVRLWRSLNQMCKRCSDTGSSVRCTQTHHRRRRVDLL